MLCLTLSGLVFCNACRVVMYAWFSSRLLLEAIFGGNIADALLKKYINREIDHNLHL